MGMNDEHSPAPDPATLDDLAVYALDAHEPDAAAAIELHLLASPAAARWEQALRDTAGEYAAAGTGDVTPSPDLRARVISAARARRAPGRDPGGRDRARHDGAGPPAPHPAAPADPVEAVGGSPADVHRIELQRAVLLLRGLRPGDWDRPLDPPEFAGWTVHDLAAHLVANESLLARNLGVPVDGVPETAGDNERRTAAARARHRDLPPAAAVDELEAAAVAVDDLVTGLDNAGLDAEVDLWGLPTPVRGALMVRAFETWTHADDVRRALGAPMQPPPPASLRAMTRMACALVPLMLAARGEHHPGRVVRLRFPDLAGVSWDVELGGAGRVSPAGDRRADAEITIDALALCRGVGDRLPPGGLAHTSRGDTALAGAIVAAVPALAVL
ncbi:MAG TPA: maleylpyruvate isomerase family mycothiol-dependent enzyme [Acidimicrobiales bacterium]